MKVATGRHGIAARKQRGMAGAEQRTGCAEELKAELGQIPERQAGDYHAHGTAASATRAARCSAEGLFVADPVYPILRSTWLTHRAVTRRSRHRLRVLPNGGRLSGEAESPNRLIEARQGREGAAGARWHIKHARTEME